MYLLIRFPVGIIVEGVVLARGRNRMRVAAAGFSDTIALTRSGQQWFAAPGQPVEFDFLMASAQEEEKLSSSTRAGLASAIGAAIPN
jgi:hypothetical protein